MKLILKLVVFDSVKGLSNGLILVMMISLLLNKQQTKPWTWVPKITFYILSDDGEDIDGVPTEAVEITCFHMVMLDHLSLFYLHIYLTCVIMIMLHCSFHTGDCLISSVTMHKLVFFSSFHWAFLRIHQSSVSWKRIVWLVYWAHEVQNLPICTVSLPLTMTVAFFLVLGWCSLHDLYPVWSTSFCCCQGITIWALEYCVSVVNIMSKQICSQLCHYLTFGRLASVLKAVIIEFHFAGS